MEKSIDSKTSKLNKSDQSNSYAYAENQSDSLDHTAQRITELMLSKENRKQGRIDLMQFWQSLAALAHSILIGQNDENTAPVILSRAMDLVEADRGILFVRERHGQLSVKSVRSRPSDVSSFEKSHTVKSISSKVATDRKPILISEQPNNSDIPGADRDHSSDLRSVVCLPVLYNEEVSGVIYLDRSYNLGGFERTDLSILEAYAAFLAPLIGESEPKTLIYRSEAMYRSLIRSAPIGVMAIDRAGRLIEMNLRAMNILDVNKDRIHLFGKTDSPTSLWEIIPANQRLRWQHMTMTAVSCNDFYWNPRYFHDTGYMEKVLSIKIQPVDNLPGGDEGLMILIEDLTEQALNEKYAIMSEKLAARGEITDLIGRKLNGMLDQVEESAQLMREHVESEKFDKVRFKCKSIINDIGSIRNYLSTLVDLSRPDTEFISYDISQLVQDCLFALKNQSRFKGIHYTVDLNSDLPNLEIDVDQIQQVISSLLENAADATEEQSIASNATVPDYNQEVSVSVDYDEETEIATIVIADNGTGMTDEILAKIFLLHFTTRKTRRGLGLFNAEQTISMHNGSISVNSTPGEGSSFTVQLPRFQPRGEQEPEFSD